MPNRTFVHLGIPVRGPHMDDWHSRLQLQYSNIEEALTWEHSLAASRPVGSHINLLSNLLVLWPHS